MADYSTISAKIEKQKKKKLDELNINITNMIRNAVDKEISEHEEQIMNEKIHEVSKILKKISNKEIISMINEERENH
ncbi:MAG: hypothetical protein EAX96_17835 [Candidatus Lokiarchaeota archaeon]|nr:hypothetical protein [Candidatus Lokiarchaeota archaeon]